MGAITLAGFGPARRTTHRLDARRLRQFLDSPDSVLVALDSCGTIGIRLVTVIMALGGRVGATDLAYQTRHADPTAVATALDRLATAGIVVRSADGSVSCTPTVAQVVVVGHRSLADTQAVINEELATICRALAIATPPRKAERIDAIRATFSDPDERARVRRELSATSLTVLAEIVAAAGPSAVDAETENPLTGPGQQLLWRVGHVPNDARLKERVDLRWGHRLEFSCSPHIASHEKGLPSATDSARTASRSGRKIARPQRRAPDTDIAAHVACSTISASGWSDGTAARDPPLRASSADRELPSPEEFTRGVRTWANSIATRRPMSSNCTDQPFGVLFATPQSPRADTSGRSQLLRERCGAAHRDGK